MSTFVDQLQSGISANQRALAEYRSYVAANPDCQLTPILLASADSILTDWARRRDTYNSCGWADVAALYDDALASMQPSAASREP